MCIINIYGEETIIAQGTLDEISCHQTPRGISKVKISLCRSKSYQRTNLKDIHSIFDQVIPVITYLKVRLPEKSLTSNNIVEALKGPGENSGKKLISEI